MRLPVLRTPGRSPLAGGVALPVGGSSTPASAREQDEDDEDEERSSELAKGAKVWYQSQSGHRMAAEVVQVHYDDVPPYYTISIDGTERSTVRGRLSLMQLPQGEARGATGRVLGNKSTNESERSRPQRVISV